MRVLISARWEHDPDHHYMMVDNRGMLIDLDGVRIHAIDPNSLTAPDVAEVSWGPSLIGNEMREFGVIHKTDGTKKTFSDREWLKPYLAMFEAEWERRAAEQRAA
jgi:hypothetical protein